MKKLLVLLLIVPIVLLFNSCDTMLKSKHAKFVPYDTINSLLLFHHIQYNGIDYYLIHTGHNVSDKYVLFGDKIEVVLVDENGELYDDCKTETAWLYQNDKEQNYIYYLDVPFTKNKEHANEKYDFS